MYFQLLITAVLAATSTAAPERKEKRQGGFNLDNFIASAVNNLGAGLPENIRETLPTDAASLDNFAQNVGGEDFGSLLSNLPSNLGDIPVTDINNILSDLAPSTVLDQLVSALPTGLQDEANSFRSSLGSAVSSVVASATSAASVQSESASASSRSSASASSAASSSASASASASASEASSASASSASATRAPTRSQTGSASAASNTAASTSNPAAKPTGAIAASFAGVVGVVGLLAAL